MKYTLAILVENHAGVLSKVAALFSRRGFNIDSLSVGVTEDTKLSRMTVVVDCDKNTIEQVEKQLNKLIDTVKVKVLPEGGYLARELTLVKISCPVKQRAEMMKTAELMNAHIIDVTATTVTLEFTDTSERTEIFLTMLRPFGIRELVRTGVSAIEKGVQTARKE
ncbi:MAG: acetolactate synthase small subunit [Clostridia bacterium]|nr:acetolactate synthase small subunit [Clostridia bacterium]